MARQRSGYTTLDLLLVSVVVSLLMGGIYEIAQRSERAARVGELVDVTRAMIQQMNASTRYSDRDTNVYGDGVVAMAVAPDYWRETATEWRNPLGQGRFSGLATGGMADGGSTYAFFYDDVPRWACIDLATRLAQIGRVRVQLQTINETLSGVRMPVDTAVLTARCDASSAIPLNIVLLGP